MYIKICTLLLSAIIILTGCESNLAGKKEVNSNSSTKSDIEIDYELEPNNITQNTKSSGDKYTSILLMKNENETFEMPVIKEHVIGNMQSAESSTESLQVTVYLFEHQESCKDIAQSDIVNEANLLQSVGYKCITPEILQDNKDSCVISFQYYSTEDNISRYISKCYHLSSKTTALVIINYDRDALTDDSEKAYREILEHYDLDIVS